MRRPNSRIKNLCLDSAARGDSPTMLATRLSTVRLGSAALACMLAMSVGGCSTVSGLSGAPRPGYQNDGSYVLSAEQQGLGCRELQERQLGLQQQLEALAEYNQAKAESVALNESLTRKGCNSVETASIKHSP